MYGPFSHHPDTELCDGKLLHFNFLRTPTPGCDLRNKFYFGAVENLTVNNKFPRGSPPLLIILIIYYLYVYI